VWKTGSDDAREPFLAQVFGREVRGLEQTIPRFLETDTAGGVRHLVAGASWTDHREVSELSWQPWRGRKLVYGALAVAVAVPALFADGGPFGLGTGLALTVVALLLGVLALLDLWFGEVLSADEEGIWLSHGPSRSECLPWTSIERIEATAVSRGLLRLTSLEIDLGERLVVLSRHRLGADPQPVADALSSARPTGSPPR
jgi:hypothetical protein